MEEEKPAESFIHITFPDGAHTTRLDANYSNIDSVQIDIAGRFLTRVVERMDRQQEEIANKKTRPIIIPKTS